jgi:DnaJ-class molecular chaperone
MPAKAKTINTDCPVCKATGRVESRLPGRKRICPECGGTGKVPARRRELLLKRAQARPDLVHFNRRRLYRHRT